MTSCMMPVQLPTTASILLKRVRSASTASIVAVSDKKSVTGSSLKACKRQLGSSPRSTANTAVVAILSSRQRPSLSPLVFANKTTMTPTRRCVVAWPVVTSCDGVRNALTFLQTSRRHALLLLLQNHWERAVGVLEKIEKASQSVCAQRRKVVIQQANAQLLHESRLAAQIDDLGLGDNAFAAPVVATPMRRQRSVRFSEHVRVAIVDDMDRASPEPSVHSREEMLVLHASRTIPQANYSEFW